MSVTLQTPYNTYTGNGVTTQFFFQFKVLAAADLQVYVAGALKVLNVDYTVAGVGADAGGSVTFTVAPANGAAVSLIRRMSATRSTDYQNQGDFLASQVNPDFDRAILLLQDVDAQLGRAIRTPADEVATIPTLPAKADRAGKFIGFDANGQPIAQSGTGADSALRTDLASAAAGVEGARLVGLRHPGASAVARTVQAKLAEAYSLVDFGGVGDGVADNAAAILAWRTACDAAGAEGVIPAGSFKILSDVALPKRCRFIGEITGAFYTTHELHSGGYVLNWRAKRPRIRGCFFCEYTGIDTGLDDTGFVEVWGGNGSSNPGTFWCKVGIAYTTKLTLNSTNFEVNQNLFIGGIARRLRLTGTGNIEANTFEALDFSNNSLAEFGVLQDDTPMRVNVIKNCYYESGSDIVGNFHIIGQQGDADAPPKIGRYAHLLASIGTNQKNRGDYLSLGTHNFANGGCWDVLDADGKPPSFSHVGGASVSVQVDATTPGGIGRRYQATFEQDQDRFGITFDTGGDAFFSAVIDYKSTLNFQLVESHDGTSAIFHTTTPATVGMPSGWKRLRISGPANPAGNTTIRLYAANGGSIAATAFSLGGVYITCERACPAPTKNPQKEAGSFTGTLTGVSGSVQVTVYYERDGNRVELFVPTLSGTSNAGTCTITGLPASLIPVRTQGHRVVLIADNGNFAFGYLELTSGGVFTVYRSATATGSDWTGSGTKTVGKFNYDYLLT